MAVALSGDRPAETESALIACPWGRVVVHSRDALIVALELSSQPAPATLSGPWTIMVEALLQGADPGPWLDMCDWQRCRPFTRTVLQTLATSVPFGSTITYAALAARAGRPGAARAIGRVMASNPFPLLVPCHRCVAATGLGGFQGSAAPSTLKRAMLDWERGCIDAVRPHPIRALKGQACPSSA